MAGIFYGWVGIFYANMAQMQDTWVFHWDSVRESKLLFDDPHAYFTNLFHDPYGGGVKEFFAGKDSYWNDLKGNFFVKVLSVFNLLSWGNYYINVIFYSFITLFGPIAIYRVMTDAFPGRKIQILLSLFLVPSFIYWTSGLHKEGLIFLGISLVVYHIYFGLRRGRISIGGILMILLGLLMVLALRNYLIPLLLAAVLAWLLASGFSKRKILVFVACYLGFLIIFFNAKKINQSLDFPQYVVTKQNEFSALLGNSSVPIDSLKPEFSSFVKNTPQAISLSMLRPYPTDVRHILSLAASLEVMAILSLFVIFIFFKRKEIHSSAFIYFCLFLAFSILIAIGYTVNNLGAIVRYRSIILPFILIPIFCGMDWDRILGLLSKYIKKRNNTIKSKENPA